MIRRAALFACLLVATSSLPCRAVVLETEALRLEIAADATLRSLCDKATEKEYAVAGTPVAIVYRGGRSVPQAEGPFATVIGRWVYQGGTQVAATHATQEGDRLCFEFGTSGVKASVRVRRTAGYLALELLGVEGGPVDRIEFLRLQLRALPNVGQWVSLAANDAFGVCLCGGNVETDIQTHPTQAPGGVLLAAAAESVPGLRGATAVLFGVRRPAASFLDAMAQVERDFHLPQGAVHRGDPRQKLSYLWAATPDPENIDEYIRFAKQGGFRVLLLSYRAFTNDPGHFAWNKRYPHGMADLQRVTAAVRAAGLKLGLHLHYSKVGKRDAYVTPVPDPRLHAVRSFTLTGPLTPTATLVPVGEDPAGATLDAGRRLFRCGRELIEYEGYTSRVPFQFTGCRRGALGTVAGAHAASEKLALLDVDTWPAFIRLDQRTDIQDEVARRIADIYRQSGPYEMVYFDGAEDVHEPFWYHVAAAQYRVYRLLQPPPAVCEAAHYTHFSWHLIPRSNAYDTVAPADGMKQFCRLMPCPTAAARALDFSRVQFGWLGHFGETKRAAAAGPDVFEYICSRAAAWDCPIALHASLVDLRSNPRADDCLAAMKIWEDARVGNHLSAADRQRLCVVAPGDARYVSCYEQRKIFQNSVENRDLSPAQQRLLTDHREHHLFLNEQGRYELVDIEPLAGVAGGAMHVDLFRRASRPKDTYALAWTDAGTVRLRVPGKVVALRPFGHEVPVQAGADATEVTEVTVGPRTYLLLAGVQGAHARQLLRRAEIAGQ
jgi:hypothetical protein